MNIQSPLNSRRSWSRALPAVAAAHFRRVPMAGPDRQTDRALQDSGTLESVGFGQFR